ncbi:hypothetical protein AWN76_010295 [Rhodothermaceae bacterium RA]|nr:hypothetical protein AWN76_010295 [Rhodothermaceae bacterium RA]
MIQPRRHLISRKKAIYPISDYLRSYLERYQRLFDQGIRYEDLTRYTNSVPLYDEQGEDTLWSTVLFSPIEQQEIHAQLCLTYALLKGYGDLSIAENLYIDRVDLCLYANTLPFRVRIVNRLNDNHDYFYVKRADANRVYGLELEHILSPSRIHYFIRDTTLIEEHIIGIPADVFMHEGMPEGRFDQVRLAKEFTKFNERCFVRLLGDMHAGNFVIDITRDFEKWHYRMRPIDFDQQSHHWRKQVYMPQFYPQNQPMIKMGMRCLVPENVLQYQREERALIANRVRVSHGRFEALMDVMSEDLIAPPENVDRLRSQLNQHYDTDRFTPCLTMGELVRVSILLLLERNSPANPPFHQRFVKDRPGTVALRNVRP